MLNKIIFYSKNTSYITILAFINNSGDSGKNGSSGITQFINIWPLDQWVWTLIFLAFFYLIILRIINKKVFNWKVGLVLYFIDILLNITIDVIVLTYGTPIFLLKMVLMCPLSLSPIIIAAEAVIYYMIIKKKLKK